MQVAFVLSAVLLGYHQATTWIPLFPWNDIKNLSLKDRVLESGVNGVFMGAGLWSLSGKNASSSSYSLIYYPLLLLAEALQWWLPYLVKDLNPRFLFDYHSRYSRTLKFLPNRWGQRSPDANHIILHLLTLFTVIAVYFQRFSRE